jgi:hypothetical protein
MVQVVSNSSMAGGLGGEVVLTESDPDSDCYGGESIDAVEVGTPEPVGALLPAAA